MNLSKTVKLSFIIGCLLTAYAAWLQIHHIANAHYLFIAAIISMIFFFVLALYEVTTSKNINRSQKTFWTFFLLFFNSIGGLGYVLFGSKKAGKNP